jgi:ribosomal protein L37AE/L43A
MPRPKYAPKLSVALVTRLYRSDALGIQDEELIADVGWRLHARCRDVLMVSDSRVRCPECRTEFEVPWLGYADEHVAECPGCGWSTTAGAYHASWRHHDLRGGNARDAFAAFVEQFPTTETYRERMLMIDRLVHAVHVTGGLAARNLFEGRPRKVVEALDSLAAAPSRESSA